MIGLSFNIEYSGVAKMSPRRWVKIVRTVYFTVGQHWHQHMLPKHFTKTGAREYGYTPRKGETGSGSRGSFWKSYTGRKQKQKGHTLPLVWSGSLRQEATGRQNITTKINGVTVNIHGRVLNFRRLKNSDINMRREISTVSASERTQLLKLAERKTLELLPKRNRKNMSVRIGV